MLREASPEKNEKKMPESRKNYLFSVSPSNAILNDF
jgi:hypothetical protein